MIMDEVKGTIKLKQLVEYFGLKVLYAGTDYETVEIGIKDANRPGLQFVGFFDYFDPRRLQVIGMAEIKLLERMDSEKRTESFAGLFRYDIPALVISRGLDCFPECMEMAKKYGRTLLSTPDTTVVFTGKVIEYLSNELAATVTRHGVLLDIHGEGVLVMGDSGIGKSESAIELVKRGHRLVADDAVDIRRISNHLIGKAPDLIRHYMEIRGIGIIDLQQLYGMGAVKDEAQIDLAVELEPWDDDKFYDRFGLDEQTMNILGIVIPKVTIPVRPGRNIASIIEVAAMNNRHKRYGYNSAQTLADELKRLNEAANGKGEK